MAFACSYVWGAVLCLFNGYRWHERRNRGNGRSFGQANCGCLAEGTSREGFRCRSEGDFGGSDDEPSECSIRLDAVSNLQKRETVNINLLTHFEYKRVLNLVKEGKSFVEAKKQAAREVFEAFGFSVEVSASEDLNIYHTSDADLILYNLSSLVDGRPEWNDWLDEEQEGCEKLQQYLDSFTDDFADDGVLSDSVLQDVAGYAYYYTSEHAAMEFTTERDIEDKEKHDADERKDHYLRKLKREYEFSKRVFLHYVDIEACTEDLWGQYREFDKPIVLNSWEREVQQGGYLLCNGFSWELTTKGHLDSLLLKIEHENGTHHHQQENREHQHHLLGGLTQIAADDFRLVGTTKAY